MDYQRTVLNSEYQKIDLEQIGLTFEFKDTNADQLVEMYSFLCREIIGKLSEQFILSVDEERDMKPLPRRSFLKNDRPVSSYRDGSCIASAVIRTPEYRKFKSYAGVVRNYTKKHQEEMSREFFDEWEHPACRMNLQHFTTPAELLDNTRKIMMIDGEKVIKNPILYDMSLSFYFYSHYDDHSQKIFFGDFHIVFSGYMLNFEYNEIGQYLKKLFSKAAGILPVITGNIFLEPSDPMKNYPLEDFFKQKHHQVTEDEWELLGQEIYERQNSLKRIEWMNYIPAFWKDRLDKNLWTDSRYIVKEEKNVISVQINKPVQDVTIVDRLELRKYLNDVMLKGSSLWIDIKDCSVVRGSMEIIPIFPEEIHVVGNGEEYSLLFLSDNDPKYMQNYEDVLPEEKYKLID